MIIDDLPKKIAVFPLTGAIFFPKTTLPLNIFEKRYIQLVDDCMKEKKLFGMIQSKSKTDIYSIGCLGKIVSFNETADNRFIIALLGVTRFKIRKELETKKLYREFEVDYKDFTDDLLPLQMDQDKFDNKLLLKKIKLFLDKKKYLIKFSELEKLSFDEMINAISMISPFSVEEKQKLVEAPSIHEKAKALDEIVNFNLLDDFNSKTLQ